MVTIQFVISITMIIGTLVVQQQLRYIQNKNVGFEKEQVLILHDTYVLNTKIQSFKAELAKLSAVSHVALAGNMPAGTSNGGMDGFQPDNGAARPETYRAKTYHIEEDYLPTLGIELAQGRNFSRAFPSDSSAVLINEAAAKEYGWKQPVGRKLMRVGNGSPDSKRTCTVVGVVKNFHHESMHEQIRSLVMFYGGDNYQMALRVQTNDIPALLKTLKQKWRAQTDSPFAYSFLNERFNTMYQSEQRIGQLFGAFAGLSIFIACLGLFGLVAFTTRLRAKEISVRKILGASVTSILALLSQDFLKLVLIAIVIASPLAYYAMHRWLSDFAYRIDISWSVFALAGTLAAGIALLTVSFQSIRAALVNPVKSLRSE